MLCDSFGAHHIFFKALDDSRVGYKTSVARKRRETDVYISLMNSRSKRLVAEAEAENTIICLALLGKRVMK